MTPLALLDVGATLVTGPARNPASRIASSLRLSDDDKAALQTALMTTPFERPREVATFLRERGVPDDGRVEAAVDEVWSAQRTEAQPIPGAEEALLRLRAAGLRIAIVSNIWKPYLAAVRAHLGLLLDEQVPAPLQLFSFRERCAKPATELYRRALERAGARPDEAVMIGDSYSEDIAPAAALGLRTVWLLHRPERELGNIARVINAEAAAPTRTLVSIRQLTAELVAGALGRSPGGLRAD